MKRSFSEKDGFVYIMTTEELTPERYKTLKSKGMQIFLKKRLEGDKDLYILKDRFVRYDTPWMSFNGYKDYILHKKKKVLKGFDDKPYETFGDIPNTEHLDYIKALKHIGYATSSTYVRTVYDILKRYDLDLLEYEFSMKKHPLLL